MKLSQYHYNYGEELAKQGYIVRCPDARGFGERRGCHQQGDEDSQMLNSSCGYLNIMATSLGQTVTGMWVWDLMRLADYALSREDVNGALSFFKRLYVNALEVFGAENKKAKLRALRLDFLVDGTGMLAYLGVLVMLIVLLLQGRISVGAFAALFASIGTMRYFLFNFVGQQIPMIAEQFGSVSNYISFLDMPERSGAIIPKHKNSGVRLDHVHFRYPGAVEEALSDVNLELRAGETLAIVGENGAGKSTLVRLMTGLFLPQQGSVMLRGVDTRDIAPETLYTFSSAVFQKFLRYRMTLRQNVTVSDYAAEKGDALIENALHQADISPQREEFPDGLDTMLSREFEGVDLSGGQWQRVSIARGLYRPHELLVLDEPTAAIDPLEEQRVYNKFVELAQGKSAVIVTHRLGSARLADRIVVMQNGTIHAIGTHDQLMDDCPLYADMFQAQAQWYVTA